MAEVSALSQTMGFVARQMMRVEPFEPQHHGVICLDFEPSIGNLLSL